VVGVDDPERTERLVDDVRERGPGDQPSRRERRGGPEASTDPREWLAASHLIPTATRRWVGNSTSDYTGDSGFNIRRQTREQGSQNAWYSMR